MNRKIVVFGVGGLGREIMSTLADSNLNSKEYEILGFIDDNIEMQGKVINGFKVIGTIEYLLNYKDQINVLIGIGEPNIKMNIVKLLQRNNKIEFPNFISRNVIIDTDNIEIGRGNTIFANCCFSPNIVIGDFNHFYYASNITHDVKIGDYNVIASNVSLSGNVTLLNKSYIGVGSIIREFVDIGEEVIIGMGSVVTKSIEDNVVAYGAPCEIRRKRNGERVFGKKR